MLYNNAQAFNVVNGKMKTSQIDHTNQVPWALMLPKGYNKDDEPDVGVPSCTCALAAWGGYGVCTIYHNYLFRADSLDVSASIGLQLMQLTQSEGAPSDCIVYHGTHCHIVRIGALFSSVANVVG